MSTLDLFAGAGGASLGLHRAGLQHLACCEWDADACATLREAGEAGFLDPGDVIEGDIRSVDWTPYVGRVDVLWASPPCQAWSAAGKRLGAADERNGWPWTLDVIDAIRPTWVLCENVPGLLMHRGDCRCPRGEPMSCPAGYWERWILPQFRSRFAWVGWTVLDSADYGVPQHRRRVYLVAGPRAIRWPEATHGSPDEIRQQGLFGSELRPWRTVREALGLQAWIREEDAGARGRPDTEPAPTVSHGGTLYAYPQDPGVRASDMLHLATGRRRLTPEECMALMAWPEGYPVQGTKTSRYRQIGNSCCPPVVEALAREVVRAGGRT